ncbi:MAG: peptidase dipeptidase [Frankiales bacterium]|nr:peptidase dipeptidase [Frankiales bacterium]
MTGLVCLQGGGEFSLGCRAMDKALLDRSHGPVVITALAAEPGADYRTATANGVSHFRVLGASEVAAAPDVREDPAAALAVLRTARLLVLPGGSPSRLLTALTTSPVGELLASLLDDGGTVLGASAGAMVLGSWTVLPDRRGPAGLVVAEGLGVVPGILVVPHWSGGTGRSDWLRAIKEGVPAGISVLGLPEESGVFVDDRGLTAVGQLPTRLVNEERDLPLGKIWRVP